MSQQQHRPSHLRHVFVSTSVYHACFTHALSTEREEVMGLLMGQTTLEGDAHIWHSVIIPRLDKRPDRVEISSERLAAAPEEALRVTEQLQQHTRVLGWYHSHPHITPFPSAVDLNTQATYQMMDPVWVGLIFSVFSSSTNRATGQHTGTVSMHCFQSIVLHGGAEIQHRKVAVTVVPDESLLSAGKRMPCAASFVSPALSVLVEAREMKNNVIAAQQKLREQQQQQQQQQKQQPRSSQDANECNCGFDRVLFDEACRSLMETQMFAVCQKLLRPVADGETAAGVIQEQEAELRRNDQSIAELQREVNRLKEMRSLRSSEG